MKKNKFNFAIYFLLISVSFLIISTSIVSFYPSNCYANGISKVNGKELPQTAQNLAWTTDGNPVCTSDREQLDFRMCSDGEGGAIFTWHEQVSLNDYDIYAQHIDSNGQLHWGVNGTVICNQSGYQWNPKICGDGDGGAIIAWEDDRNGEDDLFAQHINSNGTMEWLDNGVSISFSNRTQQDLEMVSDGAGGAIITWEELIESSDQEIYAQHIDSNGLLHWGNNGTAISDASGILKDLDMCSDGAGGAFITFGCVNYLRYYIIAQHIDSNGQPQWWVYDSGLNFSGIVITDIDAFQEAPKICRDGAGGAIITWYAHDLLYYYILAQRVNSSGQLPWGERGMFLSYDCEKVMTHPEICNDMAGGAIITWPETISGNNLDIYAQHINSSGESQWGDNGTVICDMVNRQWNPKICSDGAGGAIITWEDYRNGANDNVYAQRIDSSGNTQWKANGTFICTKDENQNKIQIFNDGGGTIIIAWRDLRNHVDYDIYAQQIYNPAPTSNHPADIITTMGGTETINWTLIDDAGGGIFRVFANNSDGNYYWVTAMTTWTNNTINYIPINRTSAGYFAYTIVYYDNQQRQGVSDTVMVQITGSESSINGYSIFILSLSICMISLIFAIRLRKKKHLNY